MRRIIVDPGSELDIALAHAEAAREPIELERGGRRYRIELMKSSGAISDAERARRKELMERTLADRNRQQPLGITTAQLIREMRAEAYGE